MSTPNSSLEYLTTTKIGEKGQLTVPKQFREDLGLGTGAPFVVLRLGDGLLLLPERRRFEELCEEVSSALTTAGVESGDLLATLGEARKGVYAKRYRSRIRQMLWLIRADTLSGIWRMFRCHSRQ